MNNYGMVSIVIPVFNVEKYICNCIESVKRQTYSNWELILIDDYSTDRSYSICRSYAENTHNILCRKNTLKGVSNARNLGMALARGEWIMFVDSDDEIADDAIEKLIAGNQQYDLIVGGFEIANEIKNRKTEYVPEIFQGEIDLFCQNIEKYTSSTPYLQGPCWKLFKLSIIKDNNLQFPPDMNYGEDAYFVYEYLISSTYIKVVSENIYKYYIRGNSLSHGFKKDKYKINLMLNKKLYDLCIHCGVDKYDVYMDNNRNAFSTHVNEIAMAINLDNRMNYIREAAKYQETRDCYALSCSMDLKKRIIGILLFLKAYRVLYIIARINVKRY